MDEINDKENKNPEVIDPVEPGDFSIPEEAVSVSPSLKYYLHKMSLWVALLFIGLMGLSKVEATGARIYDLLGKPEVSKNSNKLWLKFLSIHFEESTISYPLYGLILLSLGMLIYYVLDAKTTKYSINYRFLEIKKGILNQKVDTIELMKISDQTLDRPFLLRILGLSKLVVISRDDTHPALNISGIASDSAQTFLDFLRQNSFNSYTEYRISKDRHKESQKRPRARRENNIEDDTE